MLQPFEDFKPNYIPRLLQLGRRYLVSQTYSRIREPEDGSTNSRVNLLLSDYVEPGEARLHMNAVKKDRYAAIIDLKNPMHLKKIQEMLMAGSPYRIFLQLSGVLRNWKTWSTKDIRISSNNTWINRPTGGFPTMPL